MALSSGGEFVGLYEYRDLAEREAPDLVSLAAVVVQGGVPYLYQGLISQYLFDRDGNLDRVVLLDAKRRKLDDDRDADTEHTPIGDDRYYEIIGDAFILKYSEMQTLSIELIRLEAVTSEDVDPDGHSCVP